MELKYILEHLTGEDRQKASTVILNNNTPAKTVSELLKLGSKKVNEAVQAYNIKKQFEDAGIKGILDSCGETALYKDNLEFGAIIDELNEKSKTAKEVALLEPMLYALQGFKTEKDIQEPYELIEKLYTKLRPYKLVYDYQQKLRDEDPESIDAKKLEQCFTLPQSYIRGFIKAKYMREVRINPLILELHDKLSNLDRLSYIQHDSYMSRNGRVQIKNHLAPVLKGHKRVNEGYLINGKVYEKRGKALKAVEQIRSSIRIDEGVVYGKGFYDYKRKNGKLFINESLAESPAAVQDDEQLSPVDKDVLSGNVELVQVTGMFTICIPEAGLEITIITGETVDFGSGPEPYGDSYQAVYEILKNHGMNESEINASKVFEAADDLDLDLDLDDDEEEKDKDGKPKPKEGEEGTDDKLDLDTVSLGGDEAADAGGEQQPAAPAQPGQPALEPGQEPVDSPEIQELKKSLDDVEEDIMKIDALDPSLKEDPDITDHYAKLVGKKTLIQQELDKLVEESQSQVTQEIINESLQEPAKYQMETVNTNIECYVENVMNFHLQGDKQSIAASLGETLLTIANSALEAEQKTNLSNLVTAFSKDPSSQEIFNQIMSAIGKSAPEEPVNEDLFAQQPYDFTNQSYKVQVPAVGQEELMFKSKEPMTAENWSNAYLCMNEGEAGLQFIPGDEEEKTIVVHDQQAPVAVYDTQEQCLYHNEDTYEAFSAKHGVTGPKHYFVNTNEGEDEYNGKKGHYALAYGKKGRLAKSNVVAENLGITDQSIEDYGQDNAMPIEGDVKTCPTCQSQFRGDRTKYNEAEYCSQTCAGATTQLEHGAGYLFKSDVMVTPEQTILAGQSGTFDKDNGCFVMPDGTEIPVWEGCETVAEKIEACDPTKLQAGTSYKVRGTDRFWTFEGQTGENPLCPLYRFSDTQDNEVDLTEDQVATFICG